MATNERASVVMLRGHGEQRLKQAIMQGLVREEVAADVDEVLRQIEKIKAENAFLTDQKKRIEAELNRYRGVYFDAIRAHQREKARRANANAAISYALAFAAIFTIVLVCTLIARAIFG